MMSQVRARVGERIEAIAIQLRNINQVEKQLNVRSTWRFSKKATEDFLVWPSH